MTLVAELHRQVRHVAVDPEQDARAREVHLGLIAIGDGLLVRGVRGSSPSRGVADP
jgi:hypothetical protein